MPTLALAQGQADLIVYNARVYTADDAHPAATAVVSRTGRITYVGDSVGAFKLRTRSTRLVDARGQTVIPGMTDAHAHLSGLGAALESVDLTGADSYDEIVRRVAAKAQTLPKGVWVMGRGWDQNRWPGQQFPTHDALTKAVPDNPVYLTRVDGHAGLANAAAMRAANVTAATADPSGGRIERDANRNPTGVFVDNAQGLVTRAIPSDSREDLKRRLVAAVRESNRWGLTGVHDAGEGIRAIEVFEELAKEGKLPLRTYIMVGDNQAALDKYFAMGPRSALYDGRVWVRSVKLYADGALGSRGAALLEPYSDDPNNRGLLVSTPEHLLAITRRAAQAGFQVNTHAIGDRGNRITLDTYEQVLKENAGKDLRFRVEHAQVVSPADIPRFATLHVIPSMQASHQTSDMYWAEKRLGSERVKGAYAWRSLLNSGVVIPNGSDFPVEQVNPLISFHSAVSRQDAKNWPEGGWYADQRMTRAEALKSMTSWAAFAGFQEKDLGSISVGKYADFVILDRDIMTVPEDQILGTGVVATFVGGNAVFARGSVGGPVTKEPR